MSPSFRSLLLPLFALLCLGQLPGSLLAHSFSVGVDLVQVATFADRPPTTLELPIISSDPDSPPVGLTASNNSSGWLTTTVSTDSTGNHSLLVSCGYDQGAELSAHVTLTAGAHTVTLTVKRLCIAGFNIPKALLSPDRSKIYALYWDTVLLLDAANQNVLARARLPLPLGFALSHVGRSLSFSEDGTAIHVHLAGLPRLFRFSPGDLSPLDHLPLPPATSASAQRLFAGERNGLLYFIRYGAAISLGYYSETFSYHQSDIDIVSLASGALVQTFRFPAQSQPATLDDLVLHPSRAELWVIERLQGSYIWLRRLSLDNNGRILNEVGVPLALGHADSQLQPWYEGRHRLLLRRDVPVATLGFRRIDVTEEAPRLAGSNPLVLTLLANNGVGANADTIYRIDTKESLPTSLFRRPDGYNPLPVALSDDGRDLLALDDRPNLPRAIFLPAALAALPSKQARIPQDGQIAAPTDQLSWYSLPGADYYRVFLSLDAAGISAPEPDPSLLIGEPTEAKLTLASALEPGAVYHWRVDAVFGDRTVQGTVQSFAIAHARVESLPRQVATLAGARVRAFSLPVTTTAPDTEWELVSDHPSIIVHTRSGIGPGSADIVIDALELPVGQTAAALRLVTADGSVPVSILIATRAPQVAEAVLRPGTPRILAVGPVVSVFGESCRFLFVLDTAAKEISRCVVLPSATLDVSTLMRSSCVSATAPLHILGSNWRLGEFDPETLEIRRIINHVGEARAVRPADDGRLWILDRNHTLTRRNAAGTAPDLVLPALDARASCLSASGTTLFTLTNNQTSSNARSQTIRRYDVEGTALKLVVERTIPVSAFTSSNEQLIQGLHPSRLAHRGVIYDEWLEPVFQAPASFTFPGTAVAALTGALLQMGDDYSDARVLPPDFPLNAPLVFDPETAQLVSFVNGQIHFAPTSAFPVADAGSLSITSVGDNQAELAVQDLPVRGAWPSHLLLREISYRATGTSAPWTNRSFDLSAPIRLPNLSPETTYETRLRILLANTGPLSPWKEAVSFRTTVARPVREGPAWPRLSHFEPGDEVLLHLPLTGKNLIWEVGDLPPGLHFDPDTQTIHGRVEQPGSTRIRLTASNDGGSFTETIQIRVAGDAHKRPFARYTGLMDIWGGPLAGIWQITRSGDHITGTWRAPLFTRSFRARLSAPVLINYYDGFTNYARYAETRVSYQGVRIDMTARWNLDHDRMELFVGFLHDWEIISNDTTRDTGLASYWSARNQPHPDAGRYTALLAPGEEDGPHGAGFVQVNLAPDGTARLSGETALGQKFTQALALSNRHSQPFFYAKGLTLALGEYQLVHDIAPGPRLIGEWVWARDESRKANAYPNGFIQELLLFGAPLPPTGKKAPALNPFANDEGRANFLLHGGGLERLSEPVAQSLTPTATGLRAPKAGSPENPNRVSVKLNTGTGLVTGSAAILNATGTRMVRNQSFRGMFLKDPLGDGRDYVGGYFLLPDAKGLRQSGLLEISEPDLEPESLLELETPESLPLAP